MEPAGTRVSYDDVGPDPEQVMWWSIGESAAATTTGCALSAPAALAAAAAAPAVATRPARAATPRPKVTAGIPRSPPLLRRAVGFWSGRSVSSCTARSLRLMRVNY